MPQYIFQNDKTGEVIEIIQTMNEKHIFIDKDGFEWTRIFSIPQASIDTSINPNSSNDFVQKTKNKNYSIGDLWDISKESSEKRKKEMGHDPIREKSENEYLKKTKKKHPLKEQ